MWGNDSYQVILVDCPWPYRDKKTGGSHRSGACQQYATLSLDDLANLSIDAVAHQDAVLFEWATVPLLPEALELMKAWGFKYKTKIAWDKQLKGLGHWYRGEHEDLLVGVRGDVRPFRCQRGNVLRERRGRHSKKPQSSYDLIEKSTRGLNGRLELFARENRPGWTCLGNEIDGRDIRESLPALIPSYEYVGARFL